ncbi:DeoR family transcriptional regulator [Vibrio aphrogenes]|uniref:DeoR family transcriptional regulator n=1 Tax=Vibrio aphrogenes TaxID=1891186 RepID=UPI000B34B459|nr:DeoR family transcriptional regulator [Vibrio aphrogenes]
MITKQMERLRRIESCLKHCNKIHLKEVARLLEVSEMTVRRDLSSLAADSFSFEYYGGYIRRGVPIVDNELSTQGYALRKLSESPVSTHAKKRQKHAKTNSFISATVSDFIEMYDVVFFDNGDLIPDIIGSIPEHIEFTGVTSSLSSFLALKNKPRCHAVLQGGSYQADTDLFIALNENESVPMVFKKAIITAKGIDNQFGITTADEATYKVITAALAKSLKKYIIVEKEAHNEVKAYKISEFTDLHYLISDTNLPLVLKEKCRQSNLQTLTPETHVQLL